MLILVGAVAIAERYWSDIGLGGRLGVTFGAAGLLPSPAPASPPDTSTWHAASAAYAAVLWWRHRALLQQAALLVHSPRRQLPARRTSCTARTP